MLVTIRVGQRWKRNFDGLVTKVTSFRLEGPPTFRPTSISLAFRSGILHRENLSLDELLGNYKPTREKCQ